VLSLLRLLAEKKADAGLPDAWQQQQPQQQQPQDWWSAIVFVETKVWQAHAEACAWDMGEIVLQQLMSSAPQCIVAVMKLSLSSCPAVLAKLLQSSP
jgi:hypothetical protein